MHFISVMVDFLVIACVFVLKNLEGQEIYVGINTHIFATQQSIRPRSYGTGYVGINR